MDKTAAANLVKETFNYPFDENKFSNFSSKLLKSLDRSLESSWQSNNNLPESLKEYINGYKILGNQRNSNGEVLIVVTAKLSSENVVEKSRHIQRNFATHIIENKGADACLISFFAENYEDWRFSIVKIDYRREVSEKGKTQIKKNITNVKRFSYLVGRNEPNHTAQSQLSPLIISEKKPSIDDLVEAFSVDKINDSFFNSYRDLCFEVSNELNNLVNKDDKIKNIFSNNNLTTINFSKKLMGQIVFIYFLQKKGLMGIEKDLNGNYKRWGTGSKNFLRQLYSKKYCDYDNFFNDVLEPLFYIALNSENEFDPKLNCKVPFLNGGLFEPINDYNWEESDIKINNDILEKILDVFDQYNFTVNEEDPVEKEVAINPEMLGHIFESLIEENLRRSKGTFYTPSHIVEHMSKNTIFYFLKNKIKSTEQFSKELNFFINNYDKSVINLKISKTILEKKNEIVKNLKEITILDPSVGSGAFLVSMLQIITNILLVLDENINQNSKYKYKRELIQNNLFGVDIDESSIEIAKLRLWLSLTIDVHETEIIEPLPNLDYNIVSGDSLAEIDHNFENFVETDELLKLKKKYKNISSLKKKREQKIIISHLEEKLFSKNSFDIKLKFQDIFSPQVEGFDVIVGNPPYDVYHQEKKSQIKFFRSSKTYTNALGGKLNAYKLFLAKSVTLLKPNGILTKIFQNSFTADKTAKDLRKFFIENTEINQIESFPERDNPNKRVFKSAKMSVCIMSICNKQIVENHYLKINTHADKSLKNYKQLNFLQKDAYKVDKEFFIFPTNVTEAELKLFLKIKEKNFKTIYPYYGKSFDGEVSLTFDKHLLSPICKEGYFTLHKGAAIQKWHITNKMSQGIHEYLNFDEFKKKHSGEKSKHYKDERVVLQGMSGANDAIRIRATICPKNNFLGNSVNYLKVDNDKIKNYILLCLLNSKIINWFFKFSSTNSNVNGYEINRFPVPTIDKKNEVKIKELYSKLKLINFNSILNEDQNQNIESIESKLNLIFYKLFELSPEDISIIENKYLKI
tara:strand:- start:328 stop:3411 length:3084 start_codon:yes stop_codon:yes gene_type:complete